MVAPTFQKMTVEEFLNLPDDGVRRSLINGIVWEEGMSYRSMEHTHVTTRVGKFLDNWRDTQPPPNGLVLSGDAGFRIDADTAVGADVAYITPELIAGRPSDSRVIHGVPPLVAEILSLSDTTEIIEEKIATYMAAGVTILWIINPYSETVIVHRPDRLPTLVNADQELTAEPVLPGFRVLVADLFR